MAVPVLGLIRCNCDRCDCAASASLSSHDCKPVQCFSVQCLGAVCVAGRAQPQHEPHDGAAALTVTSMRRSRLISPWACFASVLQDASTGPTRNSDSSMQQTSRHDRDRSRDASVQVKPSCSAQQLCRAELVCATAVIIDRRSTLQGPLSSPRTTLKFAGSRKPAQRRNLALEHRQ